MINRSAVTVTAKQPFVDWLAGLPDPGETATTLEETNEDGTIYLLPECDSINEQEPLLAQFFDIIFDMELEGWSTDETHWPPDRDLSLFKEWFVVQFRSVVTDLVDGPLTDDE